MAIAPASLPPRYRLPTTCIPTTTTPSIPLTRQVSIPPSRWIGVVSNVPAGVPAAACQSPLQGSARSAAYARRSEHFWWLHLFFLGSRLDARWQEVWPRHEKKSRVWLESQPPESFFSRSDDSAVACFFSPLSGNGYSGSNGLCCQLWHSASEPC